MATFVDLGFQNSKRPINRLEYSSSEYFGPETPQIGLSYKLEWEGLLRDRPRIRERGSRGQSSAQPQRLQARANRRQQRRE